MIKYLQRLMCLLLLLGTTSSLLNAAPSMSDQAQTTTIATFAFNHANFATMPNFDIQLTTADAPLDSGAGQQTANTISKSLQEQEGTPMVRVNAIKPNLGEENFEGLYYTNTAGSQQTTGARNLWNSNKNYEGTTVEGVKANGDDFPVATSANNWTATWTHDFDDGASQQHFFANTTMRAQKTASAPIPGFFLRC